MGRLPRSLATLLAGPLLVALPRECAAQSTVVHTPVALSATPAPAVGGGTSGNYTTFTGPVVNASGQVAFSANASAGGNGIFVGAPGAVQAVGRTGGPAPAVGGGTNGTYTGFSTPMLNAVGQVAFNATASAGGQGMFVGAPGAVQAAARVGGAAPAVGGGTSGTYVGFDSVAFNAPTLNDSGQVAFRATASIAGDRVFVGAPGALQAVAQVGGAAPLVGGGASATYTGFSIPTINASGQVAFSAVTNGSAGLEGVFVSTPTGVEAVAREAAAAPAVGGGSNGTYSAIGVSNLAFSSDGKTVYLANLSSTTASDSGVFFGAPGSVLAVARRGTPAPTIGGISGLTFRSFTNASLKGNKVAFVGTNLTSSGGTVGSGVFTGTPGVGSLRGVVKTDEAVPLMPGDIDAVFGGFDRPLVNAAGQLAFTASLDGPGTTVSNDFGLFAWDPVDGLSVVAREGQQVDVDPTSGVQLKTIAANGIAFSASVADGQTGFADNGWLTYRLNFTDSTSGVFVSQFHAPPIDGDYNGDRVVNAADYDFWSQRFGGSASSPGVGADGNGDGHIDAADYVVWRDHLAPGSAAQGTGAPEPGATALSMTLLALAASQRRGRPARGDAFRPR